MGTRVWQIRVLGELSGRAGDRSFVLRADSGEGRLLARLMESPRTQLLRAAVSQELWGETHEPRGNLRQALMRLRRLLELEGGQSPRVVMSDAERLGLRPGSFESDREQFEQALQLSAVPTAEAPLREARLREAIVLYRGPFLPGFDRDPWIQGIRDTLQSAYVEALQTLAALVAGQSRIEEALEFAQAAAVAGPLATEPRRLLVQLYLALGKPERARRECRDLERALHAAGLGPAPTELFDLLQPTTSGRPDTQEPPGSVEGLYPTLWIGREDETANLVCLLREAPRGALAVTGPPGCGKTRLAVQAVLGLGALFRGSAWYADLAQARDLIGAGEIIAEAMGVAEDGEDPWEELQQALAGRSAALILENIESVAEGGELVRRLQHLSERLHLLLPCLSPPELAGLQEMQIGPLSGAGEIGGSAAALLVDRLRWWRPRANVGDAELQVVQQIAQQTEGIPLGLELAALRSRTLTLAQIRERLRKDPLELLVDADSALAALQPKAWQRRHRSMRRELQHAEGLLQPSLRRAYPRLAVLPGGFDLLAAEEMLQGQDSGLRPIPSTLAALHRLMRLGLVWPGEPPLGPAGSSHGRFSMGETVRRHAWGRLSVEERRETAERHAAYFAGWAEEQERRLTTVEQPQAQEALDRERRNVEAALDWCETSGGALHLRLVAAMCRYWLLSGQVGEATRRLERALSSRKPGGLYRVRVLVWAAHFAQFCADYARSRELAEEALSRARALGDRRSEADALTEIGWLLMIDRRYEDARALQKRALAIRLGLNDERGIGASFGSLADVHRAEGDNETARQFGAECLRRHQVLGCPSLIASARKRMGSILLACGELEAARAAYQAAAEGEEPGNSDVGSPILWRMLAQVALRRGDLDEASGALRSAAAQARKLSEPHSLLLVLEEQGLLASHQEDWQAALLCFEEGLGIALRSGDQDACIRFLRHVGEVRLEEHLPAVAEVLLTQASTLASETGHLKEQAAVQFLLHRTALAGKQTEAADRHLRKALQLFRELADQEGIARCLRWLGERAARRQEYDQALALVSESAGLYEAAGDIESALEAQHAAARIMVKEGCRLLQQRDLDRALEMFGKGLRRRQELDDCLGICQVLRLMGYAEQVAGRPERAREYFRQSLVQARAIGDEEAIRAAESALDRVRLGKQTASADRREST